MFTASRVLFILQDHLLFGHLQDVKSRSHLDLLDFLFQHLIGFSGYGHLNSIPYYIPASRVQVLNGTDVKKFLQVPKNNDVLAYVTCVYSPTTFKTIKFA